MTRFIYFTLFALIAIGSTLSSARALAEAQAEAEYGSSGVSHPSLPPPSPAPPAAMRPSILTASDPPAAFVVWSGAYFLGGAGGSEIKFPPDPNGAAGAA